MQSMMACEGGELTPFEMLNSFCSWQMNPLPQVGIVKIILRFFFCSQNSLCPAALRTCNQEMYGSIH
jgi:hypothetical protein